MLPPTPHKVNQIINLHPTDELETTRLRLRPFTPADAGELSLITSDAEVMKFIGEGVTLSEDETRNSVACIIEVFKKRGFGRWAVIHKDLDKLIGYCGFASGNPQIGVEIAYLLGRPYWGQGLASEAAGACLRYGFEELRLDRIGGVTRPGNSKSRRVLERLGMRYVSEAIYAGYDCVHYSLALNEFRPHPAAYFVRRTQAALKAERASQRS